MNIRFRPWLALLLLAGVLAGCATPETRIKNNPEVFNRLAPAQQEMIRQGRVGVGFTPEMVKLALGEPDRVWERTDASGKGETWSYLTFEGPDGAILYRGYWHRYYGGWGDPFYPYYLTVPSRQERELVKIAFRDGVVESVEQELRR